MTKPAAGSERANIKDRDDDEEDDEEEDDDDEMGKDGEDAVIEENGAVATMRLRGSSGSCALGIPKVGINKKLFLSSSFRLSAGVNFPSFSALPTARHSDTLSWAMANSR
jgi:hypothetical protein